MLNEKSDVKLERSVSGINLGKMRWNFETCCQKGLIEFVDVEEEEATMIAMNLKDLDPRFN